jgi:hypothetical protein
VKHVALAFLVSGAVALLPMLVAADEPPKEMGRTVVRVKSKNLDQVYKLPEADFSGYKGVRLDPIEVEFDTAFRAEIPAISRSPTR